MRGVKNIMFEKYRRSWPYTKRSKEYIENLPEIYSLHKSFKDTFFIQKWKFSGKCDNHNRPLIWKYEDHNGEWQHYIKVPLDHASIFIPYAWSSDKEYLEYLITKLEQENKPRYSRKRK